MKNRYKAFIAFDSMFSIIATLLILMYGLNTIKQIEDTAQKNLENQKNFDRLYAISEHSVKRGVSKKISGVNFENFVDEINFFEAQGSNCLYRIVASGKNKEIKKIYFCEE